MLAGEPTIMGLVDEIKNGNVLLPMIQRPFVWLKDEERITKLFDSVIKKFPIGIILLYQKPSGDTTQIFGRRFFDRIDDDTKFEEYDFEVKDSQILVLDGHQRLQSLYLGVIDGHLYGKHLYHNVFFFRKERDISDVSFRFFRSDKRVVSDKEDESLYLRFSDVIDIAKRISRVSPHKREKEKKPIIKKLEELIRPAGSFSEDDYRYVYEYVLGTISNSLFFRHDPHIFKYELIQDKDFDDDVLEIFVRFNQGGLPLTKSDLIFSTLKLQWKEGGTKFEDLAEDTGINKDLLLKTLIVVSSLPADTRIQKVKGKIELLKNNFEEFELVIKQFHDRVKKLTDLHGRIFRKYNFIIPVVYYFYNNREKLERIEDLSMQPRVLKYMLTIVYNSNLRSDSHLNEIIKIISDEETNEFPSERIEKYLEGKGVRGSIDEVSLNSDPVLTFSLLQRNNWNPLYYRNKLHIDHIFPLSRREELPEKLGLLVDSIFNKYVVFAGDNIRKSGALPEEYFTGERERLIDLYILPKEYLKVEDFEKMIEWRGQKIKELFKERLNLEYIKI